MRSANGSGKKGPWPHPTSAAALRTFWVPSFRSRPFQEFHPPSPSSSAGKVPPLGPAPPLRRVPLWSRPFESRHSSGPRILPLAASPSRVQRSRSTSPPRPSTAPSCPCLPHLPYHAIPHAIDLFPMLAIGDQVEVVAEANGLRQPLQNVDAEALAASFFWAGGVQRRAAGSEQAWGRWGPPPHGGKDKQQLKLRLVLSGETEAQRNYVTSPRSPSWRVLWVLGPKGRGGWGQDYWTSREKDFKTGTLGSQAVTCGCG